MVLLTMRSSGEKSPAARKVSRVHGAGIDPQLGPRARFFETAALQKQVQLAR